MSTISALISTVNGSVIEGGANISFPIDDIYIIQRDGIGSVITYNGNKYFTTTAIDSLTGTGLVMATALGVNGSLQPSPLKIAFPSAKAIVTKSTLLGSNSAVTFFGNIYYVSETQADILTAATTTAAVSTPVVVYQRKTILTDAQIKALGTPFELVPAPGEGKMILPMSGLLHINCSGGGYTNLGWSGSGETRFIVEQVGASINRLSVPPTVVLGNILANAAQLYCRLNPFGYNYKSTDFEVTAGIVNEGTPYAITDNGFTMNQPLVIYLNNFASNGDWLDIAGGDPANTMSITTFYSIVDL